MPTLLEQYRRIGAARGGIGAARALVVAEAARRRLPSPWAGARPDPALVAVLDAVGGIDTATLGHVHESALGQQARRRGGVYTTPPDVASGLVALALDGWAGSGVPVVLDVGCGAGSLLVAAANRLAAVTGRSVSDVVATSLRGVELDPVAAEMGRGALWLAADGTVPMARIERAVAVADVLTSALPRADVVVGNPPYRGRLAGPTTATAAEAAAWRHRFGPTARPFTDPAALFLLAALDAVPSGGRVALLLPESMLVTRDAGAVRAAAARLANVVAVWRAGEAVFDAAVDACAVVLERGGARTRMVTRATGRDFARAAPIDLDADQLADAPTWGALLADLRGIPPVALDPSRHLADEATVVAGFRDEFYGLLPWVVERAEPDERHPPLVTSGLIEPAHLAWGERATRIGGRRLRHPCVDLDAIEEGRGARWARRNRVPKLLVATQTRVVEVVVDVEGRLVPSVPVLAVHAHRSRLWHLAAALASAPVTAWVAARHLGAGRSAGALKLAAQQLGRVPLPAAGAAWDAGAAAYAAASAAVEGGARRDALERSSVAMCEAYGIDDPEPVLGWWRARLPR